MDNKKYCFNCGAELDAGAAFCQNCGANCAAQQPAAPSPIEQYNMNIKPPKAGIKDKIDIKQTILNNIIPVACLAIGIILIIVGIGISTPSSYISSYSMTEYVGGDAYNFIIEAGLRGGRIAAAKISKCVYICSGLLIACTAAMKLNIVKPTKDSE